MTLTSPTSSVARRDAVAQTRLLDAPRRETFDRLTRLVCQSTRAPIALFTLIADDRQFFVSEQGLGEPFSTDRATPLSYSFCQYVVGENAPLVLEDTHADPRVEGHLATTDLGIVAYLGVPIKDEHGTPLGALCSIDRVPREWTGGELNALADLAALAEAEVLRYRDQVSRSAKVPPILSGTATDADAPSLATLLAGMSATEAARARALALVLTHAEEQAHRAHVQHLEDGVQQPLVGALLHLGTGEPLATPAEMRSILRTALASSRTLSEEMQPPLGDTTDVGEALVWLADFARLAWDLHLEVRGGESAKFRDPLSFAVVLRLLRVLLADASTHSPLLLEVDDYEAELSLSLYPPPFLTPDKEEEVAVRLLAAGGTSEVVRRPDGTVLFRISLPKGSV